MAAAAVSQADIQAAVTQLDGLRKTSPNVLFFIARSKNLNIVVYEGMKKDNQLDAAKPVDVYWLDIDPAYVAAARKKGIMSDRNDLNMIENKMAYGIACEAIAGKASTYYCRLVALPAKPVTVSTDANGNVQAYIDINKKPAKLIRIYVHAVDRTLLPPKVTHVDVIGQDDQGNYVTERLNP